MKKLYLIGFIMIFLIGLSSAVIQNLPEPVNLNECVNLIQVDNVTSQTITKIAKPNQELITINALMQKNGTFFNYTFCNNNVYGEYTVNGNDNTGTVWAYDYRVGKILEIGTALMFILISCILFILLAFSIYGINKAIKGEWQIFYIALSYLLLFSLSFVFWSFSKNYLYEVQILESVFWLVWLVLGILFVPFLVIVSGYILKKEAESLMVNEYQKQGYNKSDSQEMAKSRR
jgi:hypothetical protein